MVYDEFILNLCACLLKLLWPHDLHLFKDPLKSKKCFSYVCALKSLTLTKLFISFFHNPLLKLKVLCALQKNLKFKCIWADYICRHKVEPIAV